MKYFISICLLLMALNSKAQQVPDSIKNEIAKLTCACATPQNIDQAETDDGLMKLSVCISKSIDAFAGRFGIKKNWNDDADWLTKISEDLTLLLQENCPALKKFYLKMYLNENGPDPLDNTDTRYFLVEETMKNRGLELEIDSNDLNTKRWSAKEMNNSKYKIVLDTRYVFNNSKDAATYLKVNLDEMREKGESTAYSLKTFGADESHVYGVNPVLKSIFAAKGVVQYNFIFRIKNVVAKVVVAVSTKATYNDALEIAKEAIGRINAVK